MKKFLLSLAVALSMAAASKAAYITGSITITSGIVTLNNASLGLATGAGAGTGTVSALVDGTFTGTTGASVSYSAFNWNPANTPIVPLWTFTSGLLTYSFDLLSLNVNTQTNKFLDLSGTGILHVTGYQDTVGVWSYQINDSDGKANAGSKFAFQSDNSAVPDGSTTALLMGMSMLGLGAVARFRNRR